MEKALLALLKRLSAIREDYDGLGETNIRDHMGEHIRRGFLKPESGYAPTGEYGLDPEADRKVYDALVAFCKAAGTAAKREGLTTFRKRVAAFQNSDVRTQTPGGVDYNDFFGCIDPLSFDEDGNRLPVKPPSKKGKIVRKAWQFNWDGSIDDLQATLNKAGPWSWKVVEPDYEPYLEAQPLNGVRAKIREGYEEMAADGTESPPEYAFFTLLEFMPEAAQFDDETTATFQKMLKKSRASNITEASDYDW